MHVVVVVLDFFFKFDLERNRYIKNAALFDGDSVVPLPGCLESS